MASEFEFQVIQLSASKAALIVALPRGGKLEAVSCTGRRLNLLLTRRVLTKGGQTYLLIVSDPGAHAVDVHGFSLHLRNRGEAEAGPVACMPAKWRWTAAARTAFGILAELDAPVLDSTEMLRLVRYLSTVSRQAIRLEKACRFAGGLGACVDIPHAAIQGSHKCVVVAGGAIGAANCNVHAGRRVDKLFLLLDTFCDRAFIEINEDLVELEAPSHRSLPWSESESQEMLDAAAGVLVGRTGGFPALPGELNLARRASLALADGRRVHVEGWLRGEGGFVLALRTELSSALASLTLDLGGRQLAPDAALEPVVIRGEGLAGCLVLQGFASDRVPPVIGIASAAGPTWVGSSAHLRADIERLLPRPPAGASAAGTLGLLADALARREAAARDGSLFYERFELSPSGGEGRNHVFVVIGTAGRDDDMKMTLVSLGGQADAAGRLRVVVVEQSPPPERLAMLARWSKIANLSVVAVSMEPRINLDKILSLELSSLSGRVTFLEAGTMALRHDGAGTGAVHHMWCGEVLAVSAGTPFLAALRNAEHAVASFGDIVAFSKKTADPALRDEGAFINLCDQDRSTGAGREVFAGQLVDLSA